jgi:hypothetical protein
MSAFVSFDEKLEKMNAFSRSVFVASASEGNHPT